MRLVADYLFKNDAIPSRYTLENMTDHAGPRRCNRVTREQTFGTRPSKKPSFGTRGAVLAPVFCKAKKDYIDQEAGEKYETKVVGNGSGYCFVSY